MILVSDYQLIISVSLFHYIFVPLDLIKPELTEHSTLTGKKMLKRQFSFRDQSMNNNNNVIGFARLQL